MTIIEAKEPVPECKYCTNEAWKKCAQCGKRVCESHTKSKGYSWYFDCEYVICKGCPGE